MGSQRIEQAVNALQLAGHRADRGYPGDGMPYPSSPVVAVNLHSQTDREVVLAVTVYCTVTYGGTVCEDRALAVAQVLEGIGGVCTVGACSFDSKAGMFCQRILVSWQAPEPGPGFLVKLSDTLLPYATGCQTLCTAQVKATGATDQGWTLTVEELLPLSAPQAVEPAEPFTLELLHEQLMETYGGCCWESILRQQRPEGIYQKRVARTWQARVLTPVLG